MIRRDELEPVEKLDLDTRRRQFGRGPCKRDVERARTETSDESEDAHVLRCPDRREAGSEDNLVGEQKPSARHRRVPVEAEVGAINRARELQRDPLVP